MTKHFFKRLYVYYPPDILSAVPPPLHLSPLLIISLHNLASSTLSHLFVLTPSSILLLLIPLVSHSHLPVLSLHPSIHPSLLPTSHLLSSPASLTVSHLRLLPPPVCLGFLLSFPSEAKSNLFHAPTFSHSLVFRRWHPAFYPLLRSHSFCVPLLHFFSLCVELGMQSCHLASYLSISRSPSSLWIWRLESGIFSLPSCLFVICSRLFLHLL